MLFLPCRGLQPFTRFLLACLSFLFTDASSASSTLSIHSGIGLSKFSSLASNTPTTLATALQPFRAELAQSHHEPKATNRRQQTASQQRCDSLLRLAPWPLKVPQTRSRPMSMRPRKDPGPVRPRRPRASLLYAMASTHSHSFDTVRVLTMSQ